MQHEPRRYGRPADGYLGRVPLQSSGRVRRPGRLVLAGSVLAFAIVSTGPTPASDLASNSSHPSSDAARAATAPERRTAAERYAAVRARGAPVAVIRHRTRLRAEPSASG